MARYGRSVPYQYRPARRDFLSAATDYTATPADPTGVTDSAGRVADALRSQDEPVGLTDSVFAEITIDYASNPSDNVGITDSGGTQVLEVTETVTDPVGATDSVALTSDAVRSWNDAAGVTDATSTITDYARAQSDPVGLADALSVELSRFVTVGDAVGLTDSAVPDTSTPVDYDRTIADGVAVTDADVPQTVDIDDSFADPAGVTDTVFAELSTVSDPADTAGVTDAVDAVLAAGVGKTALIYNGVAWVPRPVMRHDGSTWAQVVSMQYHNGVTWVDTL